jgi:DNA-binding NtrC family response regulator
VTAKRPRVLVIDDQPRLAEALARLAPDIELLRAGAGDRPSATSWSEAEPLLSPGRRGPDAVVLDIRFELPDEELLPDRRPLGDGAAARRLREERRRRQGIYILERVRHRLPDLAVILTTAYEDIEFEEDAIRLRADAFTWAFASGEEAGAAAVARLLRRALEERAAPPATGRFFWGASAAMRELRRRVAALAPTPMPLLVTGPTGSGKNLLVREVLHPLSGRKGPFVAFDCATVPETLLPSALFGTVRGAYTGAVTDRPGVFEAASGGTLFLDEIENLTADAQKTLLTAIDEGRIRRIGSSADVPHAARVMAASNLDLERRAADGSFRPDLLMRLNPALRLELPPLAERREDLQELSRLSARRFFEDPGHRKQIAAAVRAAGGTESEPLRPTLSPADQRVEEGSPAIVIPTRVWTAMRRHPWPGNLRQFEMVLHDMLAHAIYAAGPPEVDRAGRATFEIDARMAFGLLSGARSGDAPDRLILPRPRAATVAAYRRELEKSAFRALFREAQGDFEAMAERMTGDRSEARAARLRFNKLGLRAREER